MSLYQRKKAQFSKKRQILRMKKILTSTYECIKLRHVRHMVESSFEPQGDFEIWSIIILFRKKYNENDVVAWKLVQCLHKLMLHGHSRMRRFNDFRMEEINKLHKIWACVKIGYGPIISVYSKYLCLKASFHYMYNEVDGAFNINDTNLKVMFQNSADFIFEFFEAVARLLNSSIIIMNAILRKSFDISSSFGEYRCITFPIIYFIAEGSSLHRLTLISISELHKIADFSMLEIQRNNAKLLHDRLDIILCKARTVEYIKKFISIPHLDEIPTLTTNWRELKLSTPAEFFKDATHHYDEESDDTVENSPESQELPELELLSITPESSPISLASFHSNKNINQANEEKIDKLNKMIESKAFEIYKLNEKIESHTKTILDTQQKLSNATNENKNLLEKIHKMELERKSIINNGDENVNKKYNEMSLKYKNCFDQNKELKDKLYMTNVILDSQKEKNKDNEILLSHKNEMLDMLKQQKQTKSTINPNIKLILHSIESQIKSPIYFKIHNELIEECKIYLSNIKCKLIESIKVGSQEESEKILASQIYHIIKLKTVITFLFQQKDESTKEKILFNFSKLIRVYNSIMKMYSNSLNNEREIMFNFDVEDIAKAVGELEAMFIIIPEEKVENDSLQNEMLLTVDAIEDMSKQAELNMDKCLDSDVKVTIQYKDTLLIGSKDLLSAIKILVEKSIILQISINKTHKNISNMQFYKKHNRWKNGLISAVKAVAWSVGLFMNTAEKVIVGDETVERLIVTSHEIASSSAQLVVAGVSRANPDDPAKSDLAIASKNVKIIVSKIVNECREYIKKNEISKDEKIDICNLSKNEVKFFEMERKTAILTFERKIIEHNQFISKLRKTHYHDEEEEYE